MTMTMPRVSAECAEAVLCKALMDNPTTFAMGTLMKFHTEQPELAAMICHVADTLIGGVDGIADTEGDDVDESVAGFQEVQLTMVYALIGLVYGSVKAQFEANEMEELYS
tara:strand:- start:135 stop:464 length:330 start_codon:yes stop_codon:yes gene_type:complete